MCIRDSADDTNTNDVQGSNSCSGSAKVGHGTSNVPEGGHIDNGKSPLTGNPIGSGTPSRKDAKAKKK